MPTQIQHLIQLLAFFVEHFRGRSQGKSADWTCFQALAARVTVDQTLKGVYDGLHGRQETFGLKTVVEVARADARSQDVRANGVQRNLLFGQVFAIRADEADDTTVIR